LPYKDATSTYKETKVQTAGQGQLIVMLYDEAVRQLAKAIEISEKNQIEKDPGKIELISKSVMKTEEIITELMVSLDFDQGGEISKNLFSLYTWFNRELLEANIAQDIGRMKEVKNMLSELRNTWSAISKITAEPANRGPVGLNIAG